MIQHIIFNSPILFFLIFVPSKVSGQTTFAKQDSIKALDADSIWFNGYYAKKRGEYWKAQDSYYQALSIYEDIKDSAKYARLLSHIAILNSELDNFEKAIEYHNKALTVYRSLKDSIEISRMTNNVGLEYFHLENYTEALKHLNTSIQIKKRLKFDAFEYNYANLGRVYLKLNKVDSALLYFDLGLRSMNNDKNLTTRSDSMELMNDLGQVYLIKKQYQKSTDLFKSSFNIAKQLKAKNYITSNADYLSKIYENQDSISEAFFYRKIYNVYQDSVYAEKNNRAVGKAEMEYELEKVQERNHQTLQRQKFIIYATSMGLFFLIMFILLIIYSYRKSKKSDRLIAIKNNEINKQRINQLTSEKELNDIKANINGQEKERKRVAEELHDGIGGTLSGIKLALISAEEDIRSQKLLNIIENVDKTCQEIRSIAHNLAPPDLSQKPFTHVLYDYLAIFKNNASFELNYELYPEEELNHIPKRIQVELYRIIQEALSNSQRHAQATFVELQLTPHKEYINLLIEDNGKGFDPKKATNGIGMTNIRSRVEMINGRIDIDSQPMRGTVINIDLQVD